LRSWKLIACAAVLLCLCRGTVSAQAQVVCIDPGHPSEVNPGYTVQNGTTETHVDWLVAKRLEKLLQQKGFTVVLTKSAERQLVRNKERALIANRANAAVMVRLHCDSSTSRGYALYYPDRTGVKEGVRGPSSEIQSQSRKAAAAIAVEMQRVLATFLKFDGVKGDSKTFVGGKQGVLTGSIFSKVPVVTIEMVVLSNPDDARFIKSASGLDKMAEAIAAGIARFVRPGGQVGDH